MQFLVDKSFPVLNCDLSSSRQESTVLYYGQSTRLSNYACPCCSYTLLRHLNLEGIFWRCSHCYQEMPVY